MRHEIQDSHTLVLGIGIARRRRPRTHQGDLKRARKHLYYENEFGLRHA